MTIMKHIRLLIAVGMIPLIAACTTSRSSSDDTSSTIIDETSQEQLIDTQDQENNQPLQETDTDVVEVSELDDVAPSALNTTPPTSEAAPEPQTTTNPATYTPYTAAAVDSALVAGKKVVLFFHAQRCPTCRRADKDLTNNVAELPWDVVVFKVNYDEEKELKQQYGVTSQHTFVEIDATKTMIAKMQGGSVDELQSLFQ